MADDILFPNVPPAGAGKLASHFNAALDGGLFILITIPSCWIVAIFPG